MTPSILAWRLGWLVVLFTEIGNAKGKAGEFDLGFLSLLCFCDIQAMILRGS